MARYEVIDYTHTFARILMVMGAHTEWVMWLDLMNNYPAPWCTLRTHTNALLFMPV